ncbi:dihydropteroate synthase [Roseivirga sp. BDSF3-8]|uniref:dihydropteroate synthase n=1 Tax=Roseivirga sp. BDSF3-8 TaxID=3241598 RepID=UPI0035323F48
MGIVNVTPDSFYTGSRVNEEKDLLLRAEQMLTDGANILDIGGYSTRPGAQDISPAEEEKRVVTAVKAIYKAFPQAVISIDTFRAEVARKAVEAGAALINDVSGGTLDERMFETVAQLSVPYVLMHMKGTPQTMKSEANYQNLLEEIMSYFSEKVRVLTRMGVADIILDPGFGFAKTINHNFELLNKLEHFHIFGLPLMAGLSRKSMIHRTLQVTPEEALNGTTVCHTIALIKGASILRVHDVKEASQAIKLVRSTIN